MEIWAAGPSCREHSQQWPQTELWLFSLLSSVPEKSTSLHKQGRIEGPVRCELLPGQILAINVIILVLPTSHQLGKRWLTSVTSLAICLPSPSA